MFSSVVACEKGFWGNNCTKPCPFPSYGKECQLECSCKKEVCDHANGCQDITGTFLHAGYKCYTAAKYSLSHSFAGCFH